MTRPEKRLRAVLFDHDGTLVDSEPVHLQHWRTVLADEAVELTESFYRAEFAGIPTEGNAELLADRFRLGISPATLVERKLRVTRDYLEREAFPLVPGAGQLIADFHLRGIRQGVVTGAGPDAIRATIRAYGLAPLFAVVVTAADVQRSKPAPDGYRLALERLGVGAAECIAFEDSANGVAAAVAAGIACCAIRTRFTEDHDFSGAVATFDSLADAAAWVMARHVDGD